MKIGKSEKQSRLNFAERLRRELNKKQMMQKELASRVGISEVTVSRYMAGERMPGAYTLDKICEVLGSDPEWLFWGKKKPDKGVTQIIVEVREEMCIHYCKYSDDEVDCGMDCPLNRL